MIEAELIRDVARVADPETPVETIAEVRMRIRTRLDQIKQLWQELETSMVEHIEATGQPIVIGSIEYRAGDESKTSNRPEQKRRTLSYMLDACDGDLDALADCLYSDPFKVSEARARLTAEEFDECFVTTTKVKLIEGKPRKTLIATDTRFLPGRK